MGGIMYLIVGSVTVSIETKASLLFTLPGSFRHNSSKTCGPFIDTKYATGWDFIFQIRDKVVADVPGLAPVISVVFSPGAIAFGFFTIM
jgi:hypothetical protein